MGARIILAVLALAGVMWYLGWYNKASAEQRNKSLRSILIYGIAIVILLLVVTGRIPWLFAMFGAALPWLNRLMTARRLWAQFDSMRNPGNHSKAHNQTESNTEDINLSKQEAYDVLGLTPGATDEEIIHAHKTLMQKVHPDRGGSDYLAAKINKAKDVLIS